MGTSIIFGWTSRDADQCDSDGHVAILTILFRRNISNFAQVCRAVLVQAAELEHARALKSSLRYVSLTPECPFPSLRNLPGRSHLDLIPDDL